MRITAGNALTLRRASDGAGIFVVLNIPETKGVPLEQMDELFASFTPGSLSSLAAEFKAKASKSKAPVAGGDGGIYEIAVGDAGDDGAPILSGGPAYEAPVLSDTP